MIEEIDDLTLICDSDRVWDFRKHFVEFYWTMFEREQR